MEGVRGYSAWRWIFILEGTLTVVVALNAYVVLPDWPENTKMLNDAERRLLLNQLARDTGYAQMDRLDKKAVKRAFFDPKIWLG
jgi:hypothetical protein